ncbi:hypothetical protein [Brassicibacter mesophilus]|uniref:hypothetical protein n=1 Tax=Brassicibacter mesophilus TaxID=745119 RepID=UPI003D1CE6CC
MNKFKKYLKESCIIYKLAIVIPLLILFITKDMALYKLAPIIVIINLLFYIKKTPGNSDALKKRIYV